MSQHEKKVGLDPRECGSASAGKRRVEKDDEKTVMEPAPLQSERVERSPRSGAVPCTPPVTWAVSAVSARESPGS